MNQEVASLTPELRDRLNLSPNFSKGWEVVNPTHHPLRFIGRNNEGGLLRPITHSSLSRNKIYFSLTYRSSASANATHSAEYDKYLGRGDGVGTQRVILSLAVNDIMDAKHGLYVKEFDIVIGSVDSELRFPKVEMSTLQIHGDDTTVYQYFISDKSIKSDVVVTEIAGGIVKAQVMKIGSGPGLYLHITDSKGCRVKLIDPSPTYADNENTLRLLLDKEKEKVKPIRHESIDVSAFNNFISSVNKQSNTETAKVDREFDEEFKVRDVYRKDAMDEIKNNRTVQSESIRQTNEAMKTVQSAAATLSKVLGA